MKLTIYNEDVLALLRKTENDSVDMIWSDPDYNVGINYSGKKFTKKWDEYINWYSDLAKESYRVLKPTGNLYLLNYPKQNSYLRVKSLDQIAYDVHDYAWVYNSNVGHSNKHFTRAHRSVLHVTKSKNNSFYKDQIALPYQNLTDKRIKERLSNGSKGRMPYSWFYFDLVKNVSKKNISSHPCQIPLPLFEMLVKSCTVQGDIVFVHFGGSGSEIILLKNLRRNFISAEIHPDYYNHIVERLKNYEADQYDVSKDIY